VPIDVTVTLSHAQVRQLLSSPGGPVVADLLRRGNNVRNAALMNMRSMGIGNKVGHGQLAGSIVVEPVTIDGVPAVQIGSRLPYAIFVHDGTGIYGPTGQPIRPRRAKALRWPGINQKAGFHGGTRYQGRRRYKAGKTKNFIFARSVRGVPPRPFLREALPAAKD
jgi:hypothetical protein